MNSAVVAALALAAAPSAPQSSNPRQETPANRVESVESQGQRGGVTAGNIGTVNQVLPTLVRGPLLEKFKATFASGARIRMELFKTNASDEEYAKILDAVDAWSNNTYAWLGGDFGPYAAERFNFRTSPSLMFIGGPQDGNLRKRWNNAILAMTGWLQNLDQLMREPSLYPEK